MKAILLEKAGGVEQLKLTDIPEPVLNENEVLIQTKAISINPVDVKARANEKTLDWLFGTQRPVILGWDISGEVVAAGSDVTRFKKGDAVFGMINFPGSGKGYAEYVAAPEDQLAMKPSEISHEEAAATTLAALTAWQALVAADPVGKGDKVLIHAGAGGVGHFAIQIAKNLGAYVVATSSGKNREFILSLGADAHIDYTTDNFDEVLNDIDFVLDTVGGNVLERSVTVTRPGGRIITLPSSSFSEEAKTAAAAKNIDLKQIMVQSSGQDMQSLAAWLQEGRLKAKVAAVYPFEELAKAHLQVETGRTVGKVIVTL
ncbi:NADP-dependent oxidoreductase [Niabella beijingensis]|uniref:NADP-dependent oxidoreductase n=1 Tax=Niabella beijingensis TaxID=2872700 RepID=UPI001CBBEF83|nr:NADP-dependent oxidoreductase [Niabella beijingensis]MBZ4191499.1 NADP-dependent oxidoreductase [Niabella beijingensis]